MRISRTALSCLLRLKAYGAYPAGAAFRRWSNHSWLGSKARDEPSRALRVFPGTGEGASSATLVEDDGISLVGASTRVTIALSWTASRVRVAVGASGNYPLPYPEMRVILPEDETRTVELSLHAQLRLGMEREHEAQAFGQGLSFLHLENLPLMQAMIEIALRVTGTYWRGRANAGKVQRAFVRGHGLRVFQSAAGFEIRYGSRSSPAFRDRRRGTVPCARAADVIVRYIVASKSAAAGLSEVKRGWSSTNS